MLGVINIVILNIIISSLFSYFLAPWIKDIGEKLKILDIPDFRKIHTLPIVRIGGASIFIVFFACLLFYQYLVNLKFETNFDFHNLYIILADRYYFS